MSNLLYKEWHLAVHSVVYLFLLIGALLLVPAYPYGMIFFFGCLGLYFTSQFARELRLLSQDRSRRRISSTALSSVFPEPINIASSSASLNAAAPFSIIFSRGRSSGAHWLIDSLCLLSICYVLKV